MIEPHDYVCDATYGMGDCAVCGGVKGEKHHRWVDDGHVLVITGVREEGFPVYELVCAEPGLCTAKWSDRNEDGRELTAQESELRDRYMKKWPCWLRYWFHEDPTLSLECIENSASGPGPYAILWQFDGESCCFWLKGPASPAAEMYATGVRELVRQLT